MLGDDVYDEIVKYCDSRLEAGPPALAASRAGEGVARAHSHPQAVAPWSVPAARRPGRRELLDDLDRGTAGAAGNVSPRSTATRGWRPHPPADGTCATRSRISPTPTRWRSRPRPARRVRSTSRAAVAASGEDADLPGCAARPPPVRRRRARVVGGRPPPQHERCSTRSIRTCGFRGASACGPRRSSPRASWKRGRTGSTCAPRSASNRATPTGSAHVAWLATRALPYAYSVAGREPPPEPVRVELTLPSGASWTCGPADAANRITGPAGEYCRVFVHRMKLADARGAASRRIGRHRRALGRESVPVTTRGESGPCRCSRSKG